MTALRRLAQSRFFRGVVAIAGGTAVAQAVGVLLSPIITRLYTPEAMGLWGLFVSFLGVAAVVATLRYEVAIVAAASEEDALALTRSGLVLGIFTGLFSALILEVMRKNDVLGYGHLPPWVSLLAFPAVVAFAWGKVLRYYSVRKGTFGLVGRFTVVQGVARPLAQVFFFPLGGVGLLLGESLGRFLGLTSFIIILPKISPGVLYGLSPIRVLLRYKSYPLTMVPSGLLDTLALMAPIPVFTSLFGAGIGGNLALAQRVAALPVSLIGAAVGDVFYGEVAGLAREKPQSLRPFLIMTMLKLLSVALPIGLFLRYIAPQLTIWVFGDAWEATGKMLAALAPWMVAQLAVSPVSRAVFISRHLWIKVIYDVAFLASYGIVYKLAGLGYLKAMLVFSWTQVFLYVVYAVLLWWSVGESMVMVVREEA